MNYTALTSRLPKNFLGYAALLLWGCALLLLVRQDAYNLDDGAAKALLLSWSIADHVASSVITFGMPDFRAILYLPMGYLWTGSILAAKVFSGLLLAISAWLLYAWKSESHGDPETALIATGLLLVAPLTLISIDTIGLAPYLLATYTLAAWMDARYRAKPLMFGGWYFGLLFSCVLSTSLSPLGLAVPFSILWSWHTNPIEGKHKRNFVAGVVTVTVLVLLLRMGWAGSSWLYNPILALSMLFDNTSFADTHDTLHWVLGTVLAAALATTIFLQRSLILGDFTGRTLALGAFIGLFCADATWSLIALALILFYGLPLLLPHRHAGEGFLRQRGLVTATAFILLLVFMQLDRGHYDANRLGLLSPQDQLIRSLAGEAEQVRAANEEDTARGQQHLIVASEWPSRTMIACKCDTLPLPPGSETPEKLLANLHGITHLLLDPRTTANVALAHNLSLLGGVAETLDLQQAGVLLRINNTDKSGQ